MTVFSENRAIFEIKSKMFYSQTGRLRKYNMVHALCFLDN